MTEYKPGDRVVRNIGTSKGIKATIIRKSGTNLWPVQVDGGSSTVWHSRFFDLYKEEEYKPGDRVVRTFDDHYVGFRAGDIATLISKQGAAGWWVKRDHFSKDCYWSTSNFQKVDEMTVSVKQKALEWLTRPGKWESERGLAFIDLAKQGTFSPNVIEEGFIMRVNAYLQLNERKFCESGIAEARKEIGIEVATEEIRFTVILTRPKPDSKTIVSAWQDWIQSALQHKKESMVGYDDFSFKVNVQSL